MHKNKTKKNAERRKGILLCLKCCWRLGCENISNILNRYCSTGVSYRNLQVFWLTRYSHYCFYKVCSIHLRNHEVHNLEKWTKSLCNIWRLNNSPPIDCIPFSTPGASVHQWPMPSLSVTDLNSCLMLKISKQKLYKNPGFIVGIKWNGNHQLQSKE